jgi:hypothetical protein
MGHRPADSDCRHSLLLPLPVLSSNPTLGDTSVRHWLAANSAADASHLLQYWQPPSQMTGSNTARHSDSDFRHPLLLLPLLVLPSNPALGDTLGTALGDALGPPLGLVLGPPLGLALGPALGDELGTSVGNELGLLLGDVLGNRLGE